MKIVTFLLGFLMAFNVHAKTYYISTLNGFDGRTVLQAQSPSTPWKTIAKLNSYSNNILPGDSILFERGNYYTGGLVLNTVGSLGNELFIGSYGSGFKPVITGAQTVASWTNLGGNIWESNSAVSSLTSLNMVTINGQNVPMGRYPNTGYLSYTHDDQSDPETRIRCNSMSTTNSTDWDNAELVIRKYRWTLERHTITSHSGTLFDFNDNGSGNPPQNGYGCFIQNDVRTLDSQNEWYYNSITKKLRIYSSSMPLNVVVSSINTLMDVRSSAFVFIDNLEFRYANKFGISNEAADHNYISNCDFYNMGFMAVFSREDNSTSGTAPFVKVENCKAKDCNDAGFYLSNSNNAIVRNCLLENIGMFAGMGKIIVSGEEINGSFEGITINGNNSLAEYNTIDTVGYIGIKWSGNGSVVQYNHVNYTNFIKDDGGGIYTNPIQHGYVYSQKRYCRYNIVTHSIGAAAGTNNIKPEGHGIYNDEAADNVDYVGNTVAYCSSYGLFMNQNNRSNITGNTTYATPRGFTLQEYTAGMPFEGVTVTGNYFVARAANEYAQYYESALNGLSAFSAFNINNNVIARPIDETNPWAWWDFDGVNNIYGTLPFWQSESGKDAASTASPVQINDLANLLFFTNTTSAPQTTLLPGTCIDLHGVGYSSSITLEPYSSAVLIRSGAVNLAPVANAGSDHVIRIPITSVTVNGAGTDADGNITGYQWTKVSGPSGGIIQSPNTATTVISSLRVGTYIFRLEVTDNNGSVHTDDVTIIVKRRLSKLRTNEILVNFTP